LLLVLFSAGLFGMGELFSGCGAAGVTGGAFTSGFGVSAAIMGLVMEMTFHVQPGKISKQKIL
jgi:TM2 domain-containing membrane protein YozV